MKVRIKSDLTRKLCVYAISFLVYIFMCLSINSTVYAQKADLTRDFGIGAQGATPAFGGISMRYNGLAPVYFQSVVRFIYNDDLVDHMLGAGVSYAIFEHHGNWNHARLYFTLEGGWRMNSEYVLHDVISDTNTLAAGISFGGELVFSLGGIPLGLNMSIGQGFGNEYYGENTEGLAGVYVGAGIHAYF